MERARIARLEWLKEYPSANPQADKVRVLAVIPDLGSEQLFFGNRNVSRGKILDKVAHSSDAAGANMFRSQSSGDVLDAIAPAAE